jgi:catechol 2,3-dioxygenase-like lactoylglutathione lyase family enzyme
MTGLAPALAHWRRASIRRPGRAKLAVPPPADECDHPPFAAGLDALLERLAAERIEHEPIETYSNGVRHVNVPDPDGNTIAFAEPPDAASASPRSAGTAASS